MCKKRRACALLLENSRALLVLVPRQEHLGFVIHLTRQCREHVVVKLVLIVMHEPKQFLVSREGVEGVQRAVDGDGVVHGSKPLSFCSVNIIVPIWLFVNGFPC